MTTYTRQEVQNFAIKAGFIGSGLDIIVAISRAESGWRDRPPDFINSDGSRDRGILQFNSRWHPEVTDSCAYNPICAFQSGYRVSKQGTYFGEWSTFTNGEYKKYLVSSGVVTPSGTQQVATTDTSTLSFSTTAISTNKILNNVPGFKRIVEALDTAEQFQPFELKSSGGQDIGILGHLPFIGKDLQKDANIVTLPSDTIQAVLTFVVGNTLAFSIRTLLIFIGLVIVIALVYNALQPVIETGVDVAQTVGSFIP